MAVYPGEVLGAPTGALGTIECLVMRKNVVSPPYFWTIWQLRHFEFLENHFECIRLAETVSNRVILRRAIWRFGRDMDFSKIAVSRNCARIRGS